MNTFKTYVISLKKDIDRREHMMSIKDQIGLDFQFFNAVEPEDITKDLEERYFSHVDFYQWNINAKAAMATFMSHMKLLKWAAESKTNLLILEDDININRPFDYEQIDFGEFDLYNVGLKFSCYAYFVSHEGASNLLNHFHMVKITQAYDWELSKIKSLRFKFIDAPLFYQIQDRFPSNITPTDGYKKR